MREEDVLQGREQTSNFDSILTVNICCIRVFDVQNHGIICMLLNSFPGKVPVTQHNWLLGPYLRYFLLHSCIIKEKG